MADNPKRLLSIDVRDEHGEIIHGADMTLEDADFLEPADDFAKRVMSPMWDMVRAKELAKSPRKA